MFRNGLFGQFPDWYYSIMIGDWPVSILNAQYGNIGYIDEAMGVYRIHARGRWSQRDDVQMWQSFVEMYQTIDQHLDSRYHNLIQSAIYMRQCRIALSQDERRQAIVNWLKGITVSPLNPAMPVRGLFLLALALFFPNIYEFAKLKAKSVHAITRGRIGPQA